MPGSFVAETEAFLVQRCLSGDESAMRRLVERFQGLVFGVCLRMLGRREDAEDAAQDVFLRTFRSLHRWDADRPFTPWLVAITANRCRTALDRRSRHAIPDGSLDYAAAPAERPADLAEELDVALRELRPEYRRCFELYYRDELGVAEVGRRLGVPEGTVKTWLYRARKELAGHLARRGVTPEVHHA